MHDINKLRESIRILERKLGVLEKKQKTCGGMTFMQCHTIVEVGRSKNISLSKLAKILNLDNSTMSKSISNLVDKNLIHRDINIDDRRYITISLTTDGVQIYLEIENYMNDYFSKIYHNIPEDKRSEVLTCLDILINAIANESCCGQA